MDAPTANNMLAVITSSLLTESSNKSHVLNAVRIAREYCLFSAQKSSHLQEAIGHMHTLLNSFQHRIEGLLLLSAVLQQSNTDIFTQNAGTWLKFILQILQSHDPPVVKKIACHICQDLLNATSVFTSLSREIVAIIPQLLPLLIEAQPEWRAESFLVINCCINKYGGSCGTFKGKIEANVNTELVQENTAEEAVCCFALLARCGTSGTNGIKYTEGWTVQYSKVMGVLERIIHNLYEDLHRDTVLAAKERQQTLPLPELPQSYRDRLPILTCQFKTFVQCLQKLLSEPFPVVVRIPAREILQFCKEVFSITPKQLQSFPSTDRMMLACYLPSIHEATISLMNTVISSLKTLLLPYSKHILSMLVNILIWSHSSAEYGQGKLYSLLRIRVYQTLSSWFQKCKCFIETMNEEDTLIEELLHDCKPQVDIIKIDKGLGKSLENTDQPPTKKKKRGGYQELSQGISSQRKVDKLANCSLTEEALLALYWWISSVGPLLKEKCYKLVMDFVISMSLRVSQNRYDQEIPYSDPACRMSLLKVLKAIVMMPHAKVLSPNQCALNIFRTATRDDSPEVSTFSMEALRYLEIIVHPRAPCFLKPRILPSTDPENQSVQHYNEIPSSSSNILYSQVRLSDMSTDANSQLSSSTAVNVTSTGHWDQPSTSKVEAPHVDSPSQASIISDDSDDSSDEEVIDDSDDHQHVQHLTESDQATNSESLAKKDQIQSSRGCSSIEETSSKKNDIESSLIVRRGSISLGVGEQLVEFSDTSEQTTEEKVLISNSVEKLHTKQSDRNTQKDVNSKLGSNALLQSSDISDLERSAESVKAKDKINDKGCKSSDIMEVENSDNDKENEEVESMLMTFMDVDPDDVS